MYLEEHSFGFMMPRYAVAQSNRYNPRMASNSGERKIWTTRALLTWTTQHFERHAIDTPRLAAEMLLSHVLGVARLKLYMDPDRPATELERAAFRELVERASGHEPVDYLVGQTPFFSMMFKVTPDVLIPRPSTETIVEHVIQHAKRTPGFHRPIIADVCTGSGAIAVALAKHLPDCAVIATDISEAALAIAKENAVAHGVADKIEFKHGDLLEPLRGRRVRYLISNPPYVSDAEWEAVEPNVKDYEPTLALRGGVDGLDFVRSLLENGAELLEKPGQIVLEIAASQNGAAIELANSNGWHNANVLADHEALPRVLVADWHD